jgi:hypothetical protein
MHPSNPVIDCLTDRRPSRKFTPDSRGRASSVPPRIATATTRRALRSLGQANSQEAGIDRKEVRRRGERS